MTPFDFLNEINQGKKDLMADDIDHQVERMALRSQFEEFCERNRDCLLPKEVVLKDRLNQSTRPNLLLFSTGNHFIGEKSFFIKKE